MQQTTAEKKITFPEYLVNLREILGFKQFQLADALGISRSYIASMERGIRQPSLFILLMLRRKYGFSIDAMIDSIEVINEF